MQNYKSARNNNPGTSTARPTLARPDSELLASYYESPLANQGLNYTPNTVQKRPTHRRSLSGNSTSSSDYSSSDSGSTSDHSIEQVQPATRRASVPSEGGADRRRLAIVQMDPVPESDSPTSSSAVRSRRGLQTRLDGLALVAPPDAAPNLYEYLNPPTSAPPTTTSRSMQHHPEDKGHNRSASEATSISPKSKPSRDVGIVGTASFSAPLESPKKLRLQTATESLLPPVFQEPHSSRASSPNTAATPADAASLSPFAPKRRSTELSVHTPEIGQGKEIHVPVASPVVVNLGPDASLRVGNSTFDRRSPAPQVVEPRSASPLPPSSYLHYQPGLHATAGPLPPPPRAIFNIDPSTPPPPRPPRLHSLPPRSARRSDQPLQLAVSAVLSSSGSTTPSSTSRSISPPQAVDIGSSEDSNDETLHRREGAFSPSIISTTPSTSPSDYSPSTAHPGRAIDGLIPNVRDGTKSPVSIGSSSSGKAVSSPMVIPASQRMESLREQPGEDWTHISRERTASPSSDGHVSQDRVSWESYSPPSQEGVAPSPPAKGFKTNLTSSLKRFSSLPRTPSPSTKSLARSSSTRSRGSPSPSVALVPLPSIQQMPRRRKIISRNPPALSSADILSRKSALERCSLYAQKINELYVHDCGLSEWVLETRFRGSNGPGNRDMQPSERRGAPQPRHVSHSSMKSEATFPRRPDAMVATDLSTKPSDIAPAVPTLPYPALSPRSRTMNLPSTSLRMFGTTSPSSSKAASNFFSSLGRKASISKRERPNPMSFSLNPPTTGTRLTKSPPVSMNPRPVLISNTPSVPGGPRAPPNRALRTQSIAASSSPFSSNSSVSDRSASMAARRPSLFAPGSSPSASMSASSRSQSASGNGSPTPGPGVSDRDFERGVDKLSDLLPQAERGVLAGYLRRAGQDILAIGQYLEDEKNGTLRRD